MILVTWNGLAFTRRCLETLLKNTEYPCYEVIVVDNGSTDGTLEYLRSSHRGIRLIENGANLGFAAANNTGIAAAEPDADIVLLNNDTEIYQARWLRRIQQTAYEADDLGIVGCRLARADGTLQHAGTYMPLDSMWGQQIGGGERDVNQYNQDREVEGVVFACVYIKRAVIERIGGLDEEYFSYFEDTDYCLRAAEQGFRTVCCGSVTVVHHENASTQVNGVSHGTYFNRAQKVFKRKWRAALEARRYTRQLDWRSIFNFATGYAISSRELVCALDRQGVRLSYQYAYGPGTPFPLEEPDLSESYVANMVRERRLQPGRVQVVYAQGDVFESNSGAYKIGFTMLETDRIPEEWVRQANLMDEVWVPSTFNARTFRASGVSVPIHVIPLGVDPNYFNPGICGKTLPGVYSFLSVFEWGERKAPELLLRAFNEEFRFDEPVVLICKTINTDPGVDVPAAISSLNLNPRGGRIHVSLNHVVPTAQLGVLYRSADCFVLTTRGEGWGMPVIEAMACGRPVIATNWSAHCDFMNDENAYPLEVSELVPARAKCPYYAGFRWAEPSYQDLRRLLRRVYENPEEARTKGARAARDAAEHWTWDHAARKIIARLDAIQETAQVATGPSVRVLAAGSSGGLI